MCLCDRAVYDVLRHFGRRNVYIVSGDDRDVLSRVRCLICENGVVVDVA